MATPAIAAALTVAVGGIIYMRRNPVQAEGPNSGKAAFTSIGPLSLTKLRLASTETVNHDVKRLTFDLPEGTPRSGLPLTSALVAVAWPQGRWFPVLRPYTPVNDLDQPGSIEFLIKKYPSGAMSPHMHNLQPGATVTFMRIPAYSWKPNEQKHIGLVAGGQGITPCYQLARGILSNPAEETRVTLVWGVNGEEDIVLGRELKDLEERCPGRLRVVYAVRDGAAEGSGKVKGYITRDVLAQVGLQKGSDGAPGKVFVCGPPGMEKALTGNEGVLGQLGYTKGDIHKF